MFRSVSLCKRTVHYDNILQIVRGTIQSLSGTGCYPKDERPDYGVLPVAGRLRQLLPVSGAGKANEYEADGGRMKALKFHHADTHIINTSNIHVDKARVQVCVCTLSKIFAGMKKAVSALKSYCTYIVRFIIIITIRIIVITVAIAELQWANTQIVICMHKSKSNPDAFMCAWADSNSD